MKLNTVTIRSIIVLGLSIVILLLVLGIRSGENKGNSLPEMLPSLEITSWKQKKIDFLTKRILVFFKPDCGYCLEQIKLIGSSKVKEIPELLFISSGSKNEIEAFITELSLDYLNDKDIILLTAREIKEYFGVEAYPVTIVYGNDRRLRNNFNGLTSPDLIEKAIYE